jgi:hypothetical protein
MVNAKPELDVYQMPHIIKPDLNSIPRQSKVSLLLLSILEIILSK